MKTLTCLGHALDTSPASFGELRCSNDLLNYPEALREQMQHDGYLFLRDFLDLTSVMDARLEIVRRARHAGALDPAHPEIHAVTQPGFRATFAFGRTLAHQNPSLATPVYDGRMMEYYERLLGGPVRHFDYTWFRAVAPGDQGVYPHADVVYMGRGTKKLYSSWTPIGDVPREVGGLMILEGSHARTDQLKNYLARDVDTYCESDVDAADIRDGKKQWAWDGRLASNPVTLREKLGGRWLTTDFRAGDLLSFSVATVHASLDNQSNRLRFSSDTRYQLATDPVDERWIGDNPIAHGPDAKRSLAC